MKKLIIALIKFVESKKFSNSILILLTLIIVFSPAWASETKNDTTASNHSRLLEKIQTIKKQLTSENTAVIETPALYLKLAKTYSKLGKSKKEFEALNNASDIANLLNNQQDKLSVLIELGNYYAHRGDFNKSEKFLLSSINLAATMNNQNVTFVIKNNLANVYVSQGKFSDAYALYTDILSNENDSKNRNIYAKTHLNMARSYYTENKPIKSKQHLSKAYNATVKIVDNSEKVKLLLGIGKLFMNIGSETIPNYQEQTFNALNQAKQISSAIGDNRSLTYAYGYLGRLYEIEEKTKDALILTRNAEKLALLENMPESLYQWQWQIARLLKLSGDSSAAILAYQAAINTLEPIRHLLLRGQIRHGSFRQTIGGVYIELTDLLLTTSTDNKKDTKNITRLLVQAREIMESYKGAELQDYFQDDCVTKLTNKTRGIDKLDNHTAAIYPIVFPDRIELLLSTPDGLKRFSSNIDEKTLTNESQNFRRLVEKRTTRQYLKHAKKLYQWLIDPIKDELEKQSINTLVVIPDSILRTIPFAALHDGKQFIVNNYAIVVSPGLSLTDPQPLDREDISIMGNGITDSIQGFPALPYVDNELKNINQLYETALLKDKHFTEQNFQNTLKKQPFNIVHIASHGQFESNSQDSFLLTYSSKLTMNKLEKYLLQAKFRDKPIELLTLSACQTAKGDDRAALGLAGIAIKAGVRSAVATLWFVNDNASSTLVSDFYQQLNINTISKAKALQKAQVAMIQGDRYRHPSYWSPFLLIGNWL